MSEYSLRHLSIRVPWHDSAWDGSVCAQPAMNGACLKLRRIAAKWRFNHLVTKIRTNL